MKQAIILFSIVLVFWGCTKTNQKVKLEKIIFHTSSCFGSCPVYHLQIDNNKQIKLHAERVYKEPSDFGYFELDSSKMGYFTGSISDTVFNKLIEELSSIGLDTLVFDGVDCCDGSVITMIVYYNDGKRKFLKSMFPPTHTNQVIETLHNICEKSTLTRTPQSFSLEKE